MYSNDQIIYISNSLSLIRLLSKEWILFSRQMTDEEISFYKQEKSKFDELLKKFGWTEDYLLNEVCFY